MYVCTALCAICLYVFARTGFSLCAGTIVALSVGGGADARIHAPHITHVERCQRQRGAASSTVFLGVPRWIRGRFFVWERAYYVNMATKNRSLRNDTTKIFVRNTSSVCIYDMSSHKCGALLLLQDQVVVLLLNLRHGRGFWLLLFQYQAVVVVVALFQSEHHLVVVFGQHIHRADLHLLDD